MDSTGEHSHIPIAGRVYRCIIGIVGAVTALALPSALGDFAFDIVW
jgi:uncharacterized membrane protein YeaQ/YmgE (transglycosylase-associated protein family)